jgi:ABC-type sugar transport system, periplasmic component
MGSGGKRGGWSGSHTYSILNGCPEENLEAAASLIWILTNHEAQMHEARGGKLPTMTRVWNDIASEMDAAGNEFMSNLFSTFSASMAEDAFTPPLIPEWIPFSNIIFPELQAAIVGDKSVKEALDDAAKETDYLMQDAGYY